MLSRCGVDVQIDPVTDVWHQSSLVIDLISNFNNYVFFPKQPQLHVAKESGFQNPQHIEYFL